MTVVSEPNAPFICNHGFDPADQSDRTDIPADSIHLSGVSAKLSSVSQSLVWIATPLPGQNTDDPIARQRVTAFGMMNGHAVGQPANGNFV